MLCVQSPKLSILVLFFILLAKFAVRGGFTLKGKDCISLLIRQQLISSQADTHTHMRSNRPPSHERMCLRVVFRRSRAITESQQFKSQCHKSRTRLPCNINTQEKQQTDAYLLLEWLAELSQPERTETKTLEMHVSSQPSRLNWPIP